MAMTLRKLNQAVQWYDGMLLRPEHFQHADRRSEELSAYRFSQAKPYFYGAAHLVIDDVLLDSGLFRISEIEAVMPDGTVVTVDGEGAENLEIDLKEALKALKISEGRTKIYLALPEYRADAASLHAELPRYASAESALVINENTGEEVDRFAVLKPNLKLFIGEKPRSSFVSFPIAEILIEQNTYTLTKFIAPCMQVPLNSDLGSMVLSVIRSLRSKMSFLAERTKSEGASFVGEEAKMYISRMAANLPGLEALLSCNQAHPLDLYVKMCDLAGQLSGLIPSEVPPSFEGYNHDDLQNSFQAIIKYIDFCLQTLREGYTILKFTQEDRVFNLQLDRTIVADRMVIGIKAGLGMSIHDLVEWTTSAVVATKSFVNAIRDKRILGARRSVLDTHDRMKLMPTHDTLLVEILYDRNYIDPLDVLQIFNVADRKEKRPKDIVMYVEKRTLYETETTLSPEDNRTED